jgi:hypothetical protein
MARPEKQAKVKVKVTKTVIGHRSIARPEKLLLSKSRSDYPRTWW